MEIKKSTINNIANVAFIVAIVVGSFLLFSNRSSSASNNVNSSNTTSTASTNSAANTTSNLTTTSTAATTATVTSNSTAATNSGSTVNTDKQILDLRAKGGYSPSVIMAAANKETILRVNTQNTFDCSSAFTIPSLGIRRNLPATGSTEIALGSQKPGTEIAGTCSMGMYNFTIKFT